MSNFDYLYKKEEYSLFSHTAIEAENLYAKFPAMCAVDCRKALELAVKWVYSTDNTIRKPCKENLQSLILEPSFRFALDSKTWDKLPFIIELGNRAVHTEREVSKADVLSSLERLFDFIQWVDCCYGANYQKRRFNPELIPTEHKINFNRDTTLPVSPTINRPSVKTFSNNEQLLAREMFEEYLRKEHKKESTINSYCCAINKHVLRREKLNWNTLTYHIDRIVPLYNYDGINKEIGKIGHNTVISALKMFRKFVRYNNLGQ